LFAFRYQFQVQPVPLIDALVVPEPGKLEIQRRSAPTPQSTHALVRPRRVGICGTDYHIYEGSHPFLQYPRVMGHELAVEVVEAPPGSGVSVGTVYAVNPYLSCGHCVACRAGKRNCCVSISVLGVHRDGGMTELISVPVENLVAAEGLTVDECAAVEFLAIGAHAVRRGAVSAADRVLVVGAGPIGLGVAMFARISGARVAVLDRDPERAATARAITGVDIIPAGAEMTEAMERYTDAEGFDVVLDATGALAAMQKGFDYVAHGGRYVLVSVVREAVTFQDPDFHRKELTLLGSRNATSEDFARVIAAIRNREVDVARLITHRTTLSGAITDIPQWATQKTGLIKALIEVG
jgi:2-desacetyl-2-hydroxyethyl bacteriochlorophyllide A dehydrogenase